MTDKHLKYHHCDMTWCHCGVMARWQPCRGIHNYVPDLAAFVPFGKIIVGELVSSEGDGAGFWESLGESCFSARYARKGLSILDGNHAGLDE